MVLNHHKKKIVTRKFSIKWRSRILLLTGHLASVSGLDWARKAILYQMTILVYSSKNPLKCLGLQNSKQIFDYVHILRQDRIVTIMPPNKIERNIHSTCSDVKRPGPLPLHFAKYYISDFGHLRTHLMTLHD